MTGYTNMEGVAMSNKTASEARHVISREEADNLDKTLNILAGRAEELRERLGGVLTPSSPCGPGGSNSETVIPTASALSDRFRGMRKVAESAISTIDDILLRLDV